MVIDDEDNDGGGDDNDGNDDVVVVGGVHAVHVVVVVYTCLFYTFVGFEDLSGGDWWVWDREGCRFGLVVLVGCGWWGRCTWGDAGTVVGGLRGG